MIFVLILLVVQLKIGFFDGWKWYKQFSVRSYGFLKLGFVKDFMVFVVCVFQVLGLVVLVQKSLKELLFKVFEL